MNWFPFHLHNLGSVRGSTARLTHSRRQTNETPTPRKSKGNVENHALVLKASTST